MIMVLAEKYENAAGSATLQIGAYYVKDTGVALITMRLVDGDGNTQPPGGSPPQAAGEYSTDFGALYEFGVTCATKLGNDSVAQALHWATAQSQEARKFLGTIGDWKGPLDWNPNQQAQPKGGQQ